MAVWRSFILLVFCVASGLTGAAPASAASAKYAAFVMHADSGDVLFSRYADELRYPASLTKMMTLYLLFEELKAGRLTLDSELTVSAQAAGQPPSKLGLTAGSKIDVETAIKALVVKSANDVAVVIAEAVSGSEWRFAQKMTERAHEIGMRRTTFRNASGLPNSRQKTTARDLAILVRRIVQDFPQYYPYFSASDFEWNGKVYRTHNAVTRTFDGADGLKTGYTRISGFNLATSAVRDGQRLIGVVLGGRSVRTRDAHMKQILAGGFAQIKTRPAMIAALYRDTPTPRLKPTLLASLEREQAVAPTVGDSEPLRSEIMTAAAGFSHDNADAPAGDALGALIAAAADPDDLNEFQRARLASLSPFEGTWGEGDADAIASPGWSVQIGAYSTKERAQKELEAAAIAADLINQARAVQPTDDSSAPLFRARFTAMTAAEADETCATLRTRKIACFVVADTSAQQATPH